MRLDDIVIVLSRTSEAGNLGAVCRVMKNMGLPRLRLAAPCLEPLAESLALGGSENVIRARAVHAEDIWEEAETFSTLKEAVSDIPLVIGTTRRRGRHRKQISMTPAQTAAFLKEHPGPAALVFGNERTGLTEEEMELCNMASHIPSAPAFPSLNLSHAVMVYAYELYRTMSPAEADTVKGQWIPLDQKNQEELVAEIMDNLKLLGFYKQQGREEQRRFFRDIFSRAGFTEREGRYFAEIIAKAARLAVK